MTLEEVKRLLNDKAQAIKFEDLDSSHAGKLDIEHKSHDKTITINSFIHKTGTDKIFIFLSAVGIYREDVVFHRVYWANILKEYVFILMIPVDMRLSGLQHIFSEQSAMIIQNEYLIL